LLLATILCLALPQTASSDPSAERQAKAVTAAMHFLGLTDQGHYGESWDEASSLFVSRISREEWQRTIAGVRPAFGRLTNRMVASSKVLSSAPGVPDGEYVLFLFSSSFEHKPSAIETVTVMFDHDGQWRVAGYFIH
jgi:hypothetical protein